MSENHNSDTDVPGGQGAAELSVLETDNHRTESDMKMVKRAIRERWPVPLTTRTEVVVRLAEVIRKRSIGVPDRMGDIQDREDVADSLAIAAASVLEKMVKTNQAEEHHRDKEDRLDSGKPTEIAGQVELRVRFDE